MNGKAITAAGNGVGHSTAAAPAVLISSGATALGAMSRSAPPPLAPAEDASVQPARDRLRRLHAMQDEPSIAPEELAAANARHDREHGNPLEWQHYRLKSSWLRGAAMRRAR